MTTLEIKLKGTPPTWAKEATYYYENFHQEQWIAKKDGETVQRPFHHYCRRTRYRRKSFRITPFDRRPGIPWAKDSRGS